MIGMRMGAYHCTLLQRTSEVYDIVQMTNEGKSRWGHNLHITYTGAGKFVVPRFRDFPKHVPRPHRIVNKK